MPVVGLVPGRSSPAVVLSGAPRRRAGLAGARGPARCSSSSASRRIYAGGGSSGWKSETGEPGGLPLRRRRSGLRHGGVVWRKGCSPCPFTGTISVAARRVGSAAIFNKKGSLGRWLEGGQRSSSPAPVVSLCSALDLVPLRIVLLFLYFVLCTGYFVEYTQPFLKKRSCLPENKEQ